MKNLRAGITGALMILVMASLTTYVHALTDPTRPNGFQAPPAEAKPEKSFALASIIIGADRKIAVIDGQARREGQTFEGVRLRRIYPDRVELVDQGRVRVIRLDTLPQVRSSK